MREGKKGECYRYEKYSGNDNYVILPEHQDEFPLTVIGAKAFLSCRTVECLELPDTLERVEDWAFAYMKNLEEIVFPPKHIQFGKKVFLGCRSLKRIILRDVQEQYEGVPYFLASVATLMEEVPLDLKLAGECRGQWRWLQNYDRALISYLSGSDDTGFEPAFMGWFDVEDVDDQRRDYVLQRRRRKIGLVFQRLFYSERLEEETRHRLAGYLLGRTGEGGEYDETSIPSLFLELCKEEYGREVKYFQIWRQIGGFDVYSPRFLLEQLPQADPEVRGYLMGCGLDEERKEDFFADMEL